MNCGWNHENKMQFVFYLGVLVLFVFAICYFSTSHIDGKRSTDVGARINDSEAVNTELQRTNKVIQSEVEASIERLGSAEQELDRAENAIGKCEQILETARRRTQKTGKAVK